MDDDAPYVTITKTDDGYAVKFDSNIVNTTVSLPPDSKMSGKPNRYRRYGNATTYLQYDVGPYPIKYVKDGKTTVIASDDDYSDDAFNERESIVTDLVREWDKLNPPKGGRKTRRRNRRQRKTRHRKTKVRGKK